MKRTRGLGLTHAVIGLGVCGAAAFGGVSIRSMMVAATGTQTSVLITASSNTLMRTGITPEAMAAAGLSTSDANALFGRVADWWDENGAACAAACSSANSCGTVEDALKRKAQSGLASGGDLTALAAACAAADSARADAAEHLGGLFAAAIAGLDGTKAGKLEAIREHAAAGCNLPTAYLVVSRSEADGLALRDALAEVAANGEDADSNAEAIVATADAVAAISAAKTSLTNNLDDISAAWAAALSD